ncbi:MAG: bifunctional phosphoribosyl-AMP cyclohydrolase/phosphoribosyl-ATP diphosphatase [Gammaproteobacteria bacterium]|nr:bifunctional phosphoribosyl-AMP cyclohydrolase/phosphoribosyl-ATP diphosphatase [Gammaproteobacteria bacterium]URQ70224.1 bifunctional phosphoribosyl-AMP cyclohydrolase/phosphoribosyl-ATP diphosphatase HisIE [SAR86 cluster bacterium]URQ70234.1 bifunctional phosphoribosyl-AMP cyclohydrolase/phosphoribosyl-ATP diphosphatase HisIE [SAR86 cluster bacterium]|tara:strand:- start:5186 stop:5776 length:591 start_codon:yes stop_codon:yes gene_type:complete
METKKLNWSKGNGLLPAIIQDFNSKDILMLGFMNEEALERTLSENKVTFFSRTQDKLWRKGDTSGNSLCVKDIAIDCDKDTILVQAVNDGPTCHEGSYSCFGEQMFSLQKLEKIISDKSTADPQSSYTASLIKKGTAEIAKKVNEEAGETSISAVSKDGRIEEEAADLMYHLLVLLYDAGSNLNEVIKVLENRAEI